MVPGKGCVLNSLNTVHHKMDIVVRNHCVHKPVWSPVIGGKLIQETEEPAS